MKKTKYSLKRIFELKNYEASREGALADYGKNYELAYDQAQKDINAKEMHVFDFDDTLGITNAQTVVAAAEKRNGKMVPIRDLKARLETAGIKAQSPSEVENLLGDFNKYLANSKYLTVGPPGIRGAEPVVLDTAAYAAWKNDYIGQGHRRAVTQYNDEKTLDTVALDNQAPDGTEVHIADFSPSFQLGTVDPIDATLSVAKQNQSEGDDIGVITARKGTTELDTFSGNKAKAQNVPDINKFLSTKGISPDFTYGAADVSNNIPVTKFKLAKSEYLNSDSKDFYFYDDDIKNADYMADQMCTDKDVMTSKPGADIAIYSTHHFEKGIPAPISACNIPENFRKIIRNIILEALKNN